MKRLVTFVLMVICLCSCGPKQSVEQKDILVKVNNRVLSRADLKAVLPSRLSSADSLIWAESFVKQWVKDNLVYDVALKNLTNTDKQEIDQLVDAYRNSLIRYRYQEQLIKERLSAQISEEEMRQFYESHATDFILDHNLIKGLFLKIPVDAPNLSDVKKWYRSSSEAEIEKIEKYSVQNAAIYEYFYDKWISFGDVMATIPLKITDEDNFLRTHSFIETSDSSFCYLLNIKEYILKGDVAPFDYAHTQVLDMLVNQHKIQFLRDFEEELYNDAIRGGDVVFPTEQP